MQMKGQNLIIQCPLSKAWSLYSQTT